MNSERIEQQFGSYGVDIVESGRRRRVSSLYSLEGGRKTCRTYAIVEFSEPTRRAFAKEHGLVLAGRSIGTVFKSAGWQVRKRHVRLAEMTLAEADGCIAALMRLDVPRTVAVHSYVFEIVKDGAAYDYAAITEIHHPGYLGLAELRSIFGSVPAGAGVPAGP